MDGRRTAGHERLGTGGLHGRHPSLGGVWPATGRPRLIFAKPKISLDFLMPLGNPLGMTADAVPLDRRQRRRQETIEEVLDIAVEIMTEQGVAGLSIGEVARRMGIRPPSLYVYFPSKEALYDAVFLRGAREVQQVVTEESARLLDNLDASWSLEDV